MEDFEIFCEQIIIIMNFNKRLLSFLLGIILSHCAAAQDYSAFALPEALIKDAHTLIRKSSVDFQVNSPKNAVEKRHIVATILNDESPYNSLTVYYSKFTEVRAIEGRIYDGMGKLIRKIKKSEIDDYSAVSGFSIYDDSRVKYLEVTHNRYPYTVEFRYEVVHTGLRDYPDWYPQKGFEVGVEQADYRISLPEAMNVRFKAKNFDKKPSISEEKGRKTYQWKTTNLAAMKREPYSPPAYQYMPIVYLAPTAFSVAGYKGDMSDWQSFGQFIYNLNQGRGILSDELKVKLKNMTHEAKTDQEKIAILYKYLQKHTRYVSVQLGIGGWQTYPASYVEKNQYGDCKALTYYMRSMLEEIGIEAYPALIYNDEDIPDIQEDFTEPYFNHVILYVPNEEAPTWLECTSTYSPPNYLGYSNENRNTLIIKDKASHLLSTPSSEAKDNLQAQITKLTLEETGKARATVETKYTGNQQSKFRYFAKSKSKEDQEKELTKEIDFSGFKIGNFDFEVHDEKPEVKLKMELEVEQFASKSGKRLFFYPNMLNKHSYVPKKMDNRKIPIENTIAFLDTDRVVIALPKGYKVESQPKERVDIETDFGHYTAEISLDGNQLVYKRRYEINAFNLPATQYEDLREFLREIAKADQVKIALVKE